MVTSFSGAVVAGEYGAIAYSKSDGLWGFSHNYNNVQSAVNAAMGFCRDSGGRSCRWAVKVANSCGAVATAGKYRLFAAETGKSRAKAERNVLELCRKVHGRKCAVKVWVCSF
jgi:hypothetical protein